MQFREQHSVWSESEFKMNPPKKPTEDEIQYKKTLQSLRSRQIFIGFFAAIFMMIVPQIRDQINAKPPVETLFFILFEFIALMGVSGIVGKSNLPGNYINILFVKCFIFYDAYFKHQLNFLKGTWFTAIFGFNLSSLWKAPLPWEKLLAFIGPLIIIPTLSNIYVGDCEVISLVGTSVSTTLAMGILVSAMGMREFGETGETYHFRACLLWAYFTSIMTFFNLLFLIQRFVKYNKGQMSAERASRNLTEIMIYFLMTFIMIHYLPIIHPKFDFTTIYSLGIQDFIYQALPNRLKCIFQKDPKMNVFSVKVWKDGSWSERHEFFCK